MTIEAALDQCLEDIRQHRASVADCLARHPEHARELEPLLLAAIALEQMPDVLPSAEFKRGLRERILSFDKRDAIEPIRDLLSSSDSGPSAANPYQQEEQENSPSPVSSGSEKTQDS